jgi:exodeoxyribonuclease V gamma subunit
MREPLPLYCLSSAAFAIAAVSGDDPVRAARDAWTSGWNFDKEDRELEHQLVLGGVRTFDELLAEPLRPDEEDPRLVLDSSRSTRFGRYARRLWDGLLAHEELSGA